MDVHKMKIVYIFIVIIAYCVNRWLRTPNIPDHLLNHTAKFVPGLIDEESAEELLQLIKDMKEFPSNLNDLNFYKTVHEHIGEAQPIGESGKCDDHYLVPSQDGKLCIFPGRLDIAKHFMKYGGIEGKKERMEVAVSRLQSFGRYMFDLEQYPVVQALFRSDRFQTEARLVCPASKQVLDPFQFNFIIQVPGQSVALHLDAVYFDGATRFQYPMWLLSVMAHSGLYQHTFIDQVQVVGYLHRWTDARGGKFTYWLNNTLNPYVEEPMPRAGSFVDGSKVIHASTIYYPERNPPILDKSSENKLVYLGEDKWAVTSNGKTLKRYRTDDLRITIVYRARCFESEEKREDFSEWNGSSSGSAVRPVGEILDELKADLVENRNYEREYLDGLTAYKLGLLLLDEYIKYPIPAYGLIPYNYCLADRFFPIISPLLNLVCK